MGWWASWSSGSGQDPEDRSTPPSDSSHTEEKPKNRWLWPSSTDSDRAARAASSQTGVDWNSKLNAFDWKQFTEPRNLIPNVLLTGGILFVVYVHQRFLRRVPEATAISPADFRKRSLLGQVTSVGDGDNFRLYHTPGGRLVGWGWLPWMKVPTDKKELKDRTIHIRLAGIDAPELSHFGRPAQPYAHEAHQWLTSYLLNRRVRAHIHRVDQYKRVIATVYVRNMLDFPPFRRRDVSLEMLKRGLATIYEAKSGVEFGGEENERAYRAAEQDAKQRGRGLWKDKNFESPREYKIRMGIEYPLDGGHQNKNSEGTLSTLTRWLTPSRDAPRKRGQKER
ncbi:hypothetical protein VTN49DRAFT_4570 [Thermomyces lanuginosus]|uniref:uncharacterized protein n=1 Tax=Thermomyces lanuginosus TaxID=5541 RepID=UPI003742A03A